MVKELSLDAKFIGANPEIGKFVEFANWDIHTRRDSYIAPNSSRFYLAGRCRLASSNGQLIASWPRQMVGCPPPGLIWLPEGCLSASISWPAGYLQASSDDRLTHSWLYPTAAGSSWLHQMASKQTPPPLPRPHHWQLPGLNRAGQTSATTAAWRSANFNFLHIAPGLCKVLLKKSLSFETKVNNFILTFLHLR